MTSLAPVQFVDGLGEIEIVGDRAVLSFDSMGANIRLSLSRNALALLSRRSSAAVIDAFSSADSNVVEFKPRRLVRGKG